MNFSTKKPTYNVRMSLNENRQITDERSFETEHPVQVVLEMYAFAKKHGVNSKFESIDRGHNSCSYEARILKEDDVEGLGLIVYVVVKVENFEDPVSTLVNLVERSDP